MIAFSSRESSGGAEDIFVVDADGTNLRQITYRSGWGDRGAIWSPDGSTLLFRSRRNGTYNVVYAVPVDGGAPVPIAPSLQGGHQGPPAWSPDGSRVALGFAGDVYVVEMADTSLTRITDNPAWDGDPLWSPDGVLGFLSDRESETAGRGIYVVLPTGLERLQVHPAEGWSLSIGLAGLNSWSWSPDGQWIAISAFDANAPIADNDLYALHVDSGQLRRLTITDSPFFHTAWAPDSRHLVYEYRCFEREMWTVSVEDGTTVRLTDDQCQGTEPVWSPDGASIAYVSATTKGIWVMPADRSVEVFRVPPQTRSIEGDVDIRAAQDIADLQARGGDAYAIYGNLSITGSELVNLSALSGVVQVSRHLTIVDNPQLSSLRGLDKLCGLGKLHVVDNDALVDLRGLDALGDVIYEVSIARNRSLESMEGLSSLRLVGRLQVLDNPALRRLQGLDRLQTVGGRPETAYEDLEIVGNTSLRDLQGLDSLTHVDGHLLISGNDSLETLAGLERLQYVYTKWSRVPLLTVSDNGSLRSIAGLDSAEIYSITIAENPSLLSLAGLRGWGGGTLLVRACPRLLDLSGLGAPGRTGTVSIKDNASLTSLHGLEGVVSANSVAIQRNPALESLNGLEPLQRVRGGLSISENPSLSSLSALQALDEVVGTVRIDSNAALPPEEVTQLLTRLGKPVQVDDPDDDAGDGSETDGPDDSADDDAGDEVRPSVTALLRPYPNPFTRAATIRYALLTPGPVRIAIYGLSGQCVRTLVHRDAPAGYHVAEWNGTDDIGRPVAGGVYLVRLATASKTMTRKILRLH